LRASFYFGGHVNLLEQIIGEDPRMNFLEKCFTKLPFSLPHGGKGLKHHLNWKVVLEILETKKIFFKNC